MPYIIGGENYNVGQAYLNELARQRQLAMQDSELAFRQNEAIQNRIYQQQRDQQQQEDNDWKRQLAEQNRLDQLKQQAIENERWGLTRNDNLARLAQERADLLDQRKWQQNQADQSFGLDKDKFAYQQQRDSDALAWQKIKDQQDNARYLEQARIAAEARKEASLSSSQDRNDRLVNQQYAQRNNALRQGYEFDINNLNRQWQDAKTMGDEQSASEIASLITQRQAQYANEQRALDAQLEAGLRGKDARLRSDVVFGQISPDATESSSLEQRYIDSQDAAPTISAQQMRADSIKPNFGVSEGTQSRMAAKRAEKLADEKKRKDQEAQDKKLMEAARLAQAGNMSMDAFKAWIDEQKWDDTTKRMALSQNPTWGAVLQDEAAMTTMDPQERVNFLSELIRKTEEIKPGTDMWKQAMRQKENPQDALNYYKKRLAEEAQNAIKSRTSPEFKTGIKNIPWYDPFKPRLSNLNPMRNMYKLDSQLSEMTQGRNATDEEMARVARARARALSGNDGWMNWLQ